MGHQTTGLDFWKFDDTTEWLTPIDALCSVNIANKISQDTGKCFVLEIGVWKAAWTTQVLRTVGSAQVLGVDPYPNASVVRDNALESLRLDRVDDRFTLVPTPQLALEESASFGAAHWDLAHVDGLHTEAAVIQDLNFVYRNLSDSGVVVVDDYRHLHFPGIASALYRFLAESDMAIFLVTEAKAYLTRKSAHGSWMEFLSSVLEDFDIDHWNYYGEGTSHRYIQKPDVNGFPLVIAYDSNSRQKLLENFVQDGSAPGFKQRVRSGIKRWMPPAMAQGISKRRAP